MYAAAVVGVSIFVGAFVIWRLFVFDEHAILTLRTAMVNTVNMFAQEVLAWQSERQDDARKLARALPVDGDEGPFRAAAQWLVDGAEVGAVAQISPDGSLRRIICDPTRPGCQRNGPLDALRVSMERAGLTEFSANASDGGRVVMWADPSQRLLPRVAAWPLQPSGGSWVYIRRVGESLVQFEIDASNVSPRAIRADASRSIAELALGPAQFHDAVGPNARRILAASTVAADGNWVYGAFATPIRCSRPSGARGGAQTRCWCRWEHFST
jgi:hypothetical protein